MIPKIREGGPWVDRHHRDHHDHRDRRGHVPGPGNRPSPPGR